jgi:DNA repair exonuclease SbcCD nuclease subunit
MSKVLFIGDPHIRHTHLEAGVKLLRWLEQTIEETQPDLVVNLGDTFDTHSVIRSEVICELKKHLKIVCKDLHKPMVMVLGNHDMYKPNDAKYHALQAFYDLYPGKLYIADTPIVLFDMGFVPFLPDNKWPNLGTSIVATHNTFIGADYGYRTAQDGIHASNVSADLVVSGHIHKRQELEAGRVIYPGTPASITATDTDQAKGVLLLNTNTLEQSFIYSPFPIWRTLSIDPNADLAAAVNDVDHWIVTVKGSRPEVKAFLNADSTKKLRSEISMTIKTEFTDSAKVSKVSIKTSNLDTMVDQYMDKVYSGTQDRDVIRAAVKSALEATQL